VLLKKQLESEKTRVNGLQYQKKELERKLKTKETEVQKLKNLSDQYRNLNAMSPTSIQGSHLIELEQLRRELEEARRRIRELEATNVNLAHLLAEKEAIIENMSRENSDLKITFASVNTKVATIKDELTRILTGSLANAPQNSTLANDLGRALSIVEELHGETKTTLENFSQTSHTLATEPNNNTSTSAGTPGATRTHDFDSPSTTSNISIPIKTTSPSPHNHNEDYDKKIKYLYKLLHEKTERIRKLELQLVTTTTTIDKPQDYQYNSTTQSSPAGKDESHHKNFKREYESLTREFMQTKQQVRDLQGQNEQSAEEIYRLKVKLHESRADFSNLSAQMARDVTPQPDLQAVKKQSEQYAQELARMEVRYKMTVESLESDLKTARRRVLDISGDRDLLEKQLNSLKSRVVDFDVEIGSRDDKIVRLSEEVNGFSGECVVLREDLKEKERLLGEEMVKVEEYERKLEDMGAVEKQHQKEVNEMKNQIHKIEKVNEQLRKKLENVEKSKALFESDNEELKKLVEEMEARTGPHIRNDVIEQLSMIILSKDKADTLGDNTKELIRELFGENYSEVIQQYLDRIKELEFRNKKLVQCLKEEVTRTKRILSVRADHAQIVLGILDTLEDIPEDELSLALLVKRDELNNMRPDIETKLSAIDTEHLRVEKQDMLIDRESLIAGKGLYEKAGFVNQDKQGATLFGSTDDEKFLAVDNYVAERDQKQKVKEAHGLKMREIAELNEELKSKLQMQQSQISVLLKENKRFKEGKEGKSPSKTGTIETFQDLCAREPAVSEDIILRNDLLCFLQCESAAVESLLQAKAGEE